MPLFLPMVSLSAAFCLWEYHLLLEARHKVSFSRLDLWPALIPALALGFSGIVIAFALAALVFLGGAVFRETKDSVMEVAIGHLAGIFYIILPFSLLVLLEFKDPLLVIFLFGLVWAGDIGAYIVGKLWGKTPLMPSVSPNKSMEGFGGGLAASLALAYVFGVTLLAGYGLYFILLCGLLISFVAPVGDLFRIPS